MIAPIDLDAVSASFVGGPVVFAIVAGGGLIAAVSFAAAMIVKVMTFFDDRSRQQHAEKVARYEAWVAEERAKNPAFDEMLSPNYAGRGAGSGLSVSSPVSEPSGLDASDVVGAAIVADLFSSDSSSSSSSSIDTAEPSFAGDGGDFGGGGSSGEW